VNGLAGIYNVADSRFLISKAAASVVEIVGIVLRNREGKEQGKVLDGVSRIHIFVYVLVFELLRKLDE